MSVQNVPVSQVDIEICDWISDGFDMLRARGEKPGDDQSH